MKVSLRRLRPADVGEIVAIEALVVPEAWSATSVQRLVDRPGCVGIVAEALHVVGHVITTVAADEAEVITLAVAPQARRRGIGRRLMEGARAEWIARGATRAFLEVRVDNEAAQELYASLGFTEVGRRRGYYGDGTDALVLAVELGDTRLSG